MNRDAEHVAIEIGKTANWVKRNAQRLPHHKFGRTYVWTDEDVADILAAARRRPDVTSDDDEMRPLTGRSR